jgi:non-specific serine/threonine protein kinase/serine/threonine-protein kinase
MDARWQRVEQIFSAAEGLPKEERPMLLDRFCAGDEDLRRDVETLLAHHDSSDEFIEQAIGHFALEDPDALGANSETGPVPCTVDTVQVGPYRIVRQIGSGGMGVLYEAIREDEFQKRVALKVIKRGMDSTSIIRRFHRERQILAGLSHPNIASLLDGGTTVDGRPYFAMEYVEGRPIMDYCDGCQLTIRQRLELFRKICGAVQHAHQNLVVHRDLKPSNILVTQDGDPKLLDFGIAKILNQAVTSETLDMTVASMRVMTPEYASPEQVRGEPITTSTDVYSLGLLFYELLTGHRPYRFKTRTPQDIAQVVCEHQPEKPSVVITRVEHEPADKSHKALTPEAVSAPREGQPRQLRKRLSGDLDNIALKALQKEPRRRYTSVEQFSEDIRRYLGGLPILARKDTLTYRASKFIRRHKASTLGAALLTLSLLGGTAATLWQAHIARTERAQAQERFDDVRTLANSLLFELHDAIAPLPGATAARELVVKRALEFLDKLARHAGNDVPLRRELATAYHRLGTLQGTAQGVSNLGNPAAAIESFRKAARLAEQNAAATGSIPDRRWLAQAYDELAYLMPPKEADEYARKALEVRKTMAARLPETEAAQELAYSDYSLADRAVARRDFSAALEGFRKALAGWEMAAKAAPAGRAGDSSMGRRMNNIALAHKRIAAMLADSEKPNEALEHYRAAESIEEALLRVDSHDANRRLDATFTQSDIGSALWKLGDRGAALIRYRKALSVREELAAADPKDARVHWALASTYTRLGQCLWGMGDRTGSLSSYRRALTVREAMLSAGQMPIRAEIGIVYTCYQLGSAYRQLAEQAGSPAARRLHLWRTACDFFARANQSVTRLKPQMELGKESSWYSAGIYETGAAARIVAELPDQMQACDVAIAGSPGK